MRSRPRSSRRHGRSPERTEPTRKRTFPAGGLRETTRGVRGTRRRGLARRESPDEPSLRGRDPYRMSGSPRRAPAVPGLVHARPRSKGGARREWSFARVTTERSVAGKVVDGMAPRSGADHARDGGAGSAQVGSASSNADRGGNLARRRMESSGGCARASKNVRQKLDVSGFGLHEAPRARSRADPV